jgi:hypothetical protein
VSDLFNNGFDGIFSVHGFKYTIGYIQMDIEEFQPLPRHHTATKQQF